jgi:hypothetical protein
MPVKVRVIIHQQVVDTHINEVRMSDQANVEDANRTIVAATSATGAGGSNDHQVQERCLFACNFGARSTPYGFPLLL